MAATRCKKVVTEAFLPLCYINFPLTTLSKRLGTEETNFWSFSGGILSHSCLMYSLSCSTVRDLHCCILHFIMLHTFSMGDRSGLQAGQSSTCTLLLWSHAVVTRAECGLALSCWNKQGRPWKRRCLDGNICCSKTCMYLSALMVPSQMCKLPMPWALIHPHTITDAGFWTLLL